MPIREVMPYQKQFIQVLDRRMAYVAVGDGDPIVIVHGNPTSSFLWRNIIPHVEKQGRCIAPDLIGMGESEKLPDSGPGSYSYLENRRYLDALLESLGVRSNVVLVGHDWGSVLVFDWAKRHPGAVIGIAFMEALAPVTWDQWSASTREFFEKIRSPEGEHMILDENLFVEWLLPQRVMRKLTDKEMETYRRPFREPGESRRPTLSWPRQLPIQGEPREIVDIVRSNMEWLEGSPIPKLFIRADPGTIAPEEIQLYRSFPSVTEVTVKGLHFLQEDSPDEIGEALARWHSALPR